MLSNAFIHIITGHGIFASRQDKKPHEQMDSFDDSHRIDVYEELPDIREWSKGPGHINDEKSDAFDFTYCSNNKPDWMSIDTLSAWILPNRDKIGRV